MTEKVLLEKKLTIFEYRRGRNIDNYIRTTFSHLGKCSNKKLRTLTLVNGGTNWNTVDLISTLSNVNDVKTSDLLAFLVMTLFFSPCSYLKIACGGGVHFCKVASLWKYPWGRFFYDNLKKSLADVSFYFHLQLRKTIPERLLSYEVTLVKTCNKTVPEQVK